MSNSPYQKTPITSNYLDIMVPMKLEKRTEDEDFTITPEYNFRPDKLANELYGDAGFYYVFALRNMDKIEDPIFDFKTGLVIKLPSVAAVRNMK